MPHVQFIGRFDMRTPDAPKAAWPGARIVAKFQGTRVSARLAELTETWMEGGPSEWDVAIDGTWGTKLVTTAGEHDYELAKGLADGPHTVELFRRSEAQSGTTQFLGFDFGGGTLLPPPARRVRKIEIVGDSAASGYGVDGLNHPGNDCPGADYAAKWANFRLSFGARLADMVDADVAGTVHSGKGIVKNIWRPDTETLPVLFPRAIPADASSTWDFSAFQPDVVVVMAGGNDFDIGQPSDDGPATLAEFTSRYDAFVQTIRTSYAKAHVFLVVSPSASDANPPQRNARTNILAGVDAVARQRNDAGDPNVHAIVPATAQPGEMTACDGHGNPQFHARMAKELAAAIKPKLGW